MKHCHLPRQARDKYNERCEREKQRLAFPQASARCHPGAKAATAEVHTRTSRTDRGVHALANVAHIKVVTDFEKGSAAAPPLAEQPWLEAVRAELPATVTVCENRVVVHRFKLKTIILPRQARDKHTESTQKGPRFLRCCNASTLQSRTPTCAGRARSASTATMCPTGRCSPPRSRRRRRRQRRRRPTAAAAALCGSAACRMSAAQRQSR